MAIDADKKPQTVHKHSGQTISQITRLVEIDIEKKKNNKTVQILSELTFPRVNVHEIAKQFYNYMIHESVFDEAKKQNVSNLSSEWIFICFAVCNNLIFWSESGITFQKAPTYMTHSK